MNYQEPCRLDLRPPQEGAIVTFKPELIVQVVSVGRDQLQNPVASRETVYELKMPLPEPRPEFELSYGGVRTPQPESTTMRRELWQIEDFFANLGLDLPSRTKAKSLATQCVNQKGQIEKLQFELVTERERKQQLVEEVRTTSERMLDENCREIGKWRAYAEALEARIERNGGRISAKMFATRPEPRG